MQSYQQIFNKANIREKKKHDLLLDTGKIDRILSTKVSELSPSTKKVRKSSKYLTKMDAVEAGIPSGHVMSGFGGELKERFTSALSDPQYRGMESDQILRRITQGMMMGEDSGGGISRLEASHKAKLRADTSITNLFGLLGEDEDVKGLPGYEEYKEEVTSAPGKSHWTHPGESAAWGAGFSLLGAGAKRAAAKAGLTWAGRKLMVSPNPLSIAAGAAFISIPMFMGWDAASNVIAKTDYGKAREGTWEKIGVDLLLGGVIGGYGIHKGITKGLAKATEKELLSKNAIKLLQRDPTAAKAINVGLLAKEANREAFRVNAIIMESVKPKEVMEKMTEIDAFRQMVKSGQVEIDTFENAFPGFREWQREGVTGEAAQKALQGRAVRSSKVMGINVADVMPGRGGKAVDVKFLRPEGSTLLPITDSVTIKNETSRLYQNLAALSKSSTTFAPTKAEIISAKRLEAESVNNILNKAKEKRIPVRQAIAEEQQVRAAAARVREQERIALGLAKGKERKIVPTSPKETKAVKVVEESVIAEKVVQKPVKVASGKGVESYTWKDGSSQKIIKLTRKRYDELIAGTEGAPEWSSGKYVSLVKKPGSDEWFLHNYGSLYEVRPTGANVGEWALEGKLTFGKAKTPKGELTLEGILKEGKKAKTAAKKESVLEEIPKKAEIPEFKTTGEALTFGKSATLKQVTELKRLRKESLVKSNKMLAKVPGESDDALMARLEEASPETTKGQLYREAIEASEKGKKTNALSKYKGKKLTKEELAKISGEEGEIAAGKVTNETILWEGKTEKTTMGDVLEKVKSGDKSLQNDLHAIASSHADFVDVMGEASIGARLLASGVPKAEVTKLLPSYKKMYSKALKKEGLYAKGKAVTRGTEEIESELAAEDTALRLGFDPGRKSKPPKKDSTSTVVKSGLSDEQRQIASDNMAIASGDLGLVDDAVMATGALEEQAAELLTKATKGEVAKGNKKLLAIIGLTSIPLIGVLGLPEDSDAGVVAAVARTNVPRKLVNMAENASGGVISKGIGYVSSWMEAGFTYTAAPEGSKVVAKAQNVLRTAPLFMKEVGGKGISNIIKTTKRVLPLMSKMTPFTVMDLMYKQGHSAAPEIGMVQNAIANVVNGNLRTLGNILKDVPALRKEKAMEIITSEMAPLAKQFSGDVGAYRVAEMRLNKLNPKLKKIIKSLSADGRKNKKKNAKIDNLRAEISATEKAFAECEPGFRAFEKEWEVKAQDLAKRYSASRIFFAVEDTTDHTVYPWLKGMLSAEEKEAVSYIKLMNQDYAKRIEAAGMDTIKGPYVHHPFHPAWSDKAIDARLASFGLESSGIPYSKFFRRSKYSKGLVPDIAYAQQKYILDAERRIQWNQFWGKGKKDSWHAHRNSPIVKNAPVLEKAWQQIEQSMIPPVDTRVNRLMDRYSSFEVLRLLAFSGSVAFKHYFKNIGTASSMGVGEFAHSFTDAWGMAIRNSRHSPEMQATFKKLGIKGVGQKKFMDDAARSITFQSRGMNMIADLDFTSSVINKPGFWGAFDKTLNKINKVGSVPVRITESVDRHHTFLASLHMAEKKGMTPDQALYAVYSNILKNNFLSGSLNPSWMREPSIRALFLFQNTGFKIMERRLVTAYNSGKDIVNLGKVIKGRIKNGEIPLLLREMVDLGSHMLKAEHTMKQNMIYDALFQSNSRDLMGRSYMRQAMTEMIASGIILGGGGAIGMDLIPQLWHVPFQKHGASEPSLAVNPIIAATFTNMHRREAAEEYGEDKDFFVSGFLKSYFGSTGYMNMTMWKVFRGIRRGEDDIPARYNGSWLKYFFSIPSSEE